MVSYPLHSSYKDSFAVWTHLLLFSCQQVPPHGQQLCQLLLTTHSKKQKNYYRCWGSVTFWCGPGSGSRSGYIPLTNGSGPGSNSGSDSFLHYFKDAKKKFFCTFFLITCPQVHHLQSKKCDFLLKVCVKMLFCRHYFSPLNTFMRKEKDPDPHLLLMDPDPGGPKTWGSCGSRSGSLTLIITSDMEGEECRSTPSNNFGFSKDLLMKILAKKP